MSFNCGHHSSYFPGNVYDSGPFASGVSLYTSTQRKEKTKEQSLQLRPTGPEI